jgi:hypothetical protein
MHTQSVGADVGAVVGAGRGTLVTPVHLTAVTAVAVATVVGVGVCGVGRGGGRWRPLPAGAVTM